MINHLIPFVNSANEVLSMYSLRQKVAEKKNQPSLNGRN